MLLPISAQFWPKPPSPQDRLPWFTLAWLVLGVVAMLVAGRRITDPPAVAEPAAAAQPKQPA